MVCFKQGLQLKEQGPDFEQKVLLKEGVILQKGFFKFVVIRPAVVEGEPRAWGAPKG
jgi:hypothetical protein